MTLSCHAAITELALRSTGPKGELQRIESPIPPSTSVPRSEEFSTFANGFVGLLERRKGDNPEPVDVQEAEHQPIHIHFAASTSASSHSGYGHLQWLGSEVPQMTRPIDHEYNFGFDLTTSSSFQQLSPKRLHASLTRPPSDPKDTDALNPILDNQEPFRFGFEFESGLVKRVPSYGNSGGEAMRRIECAFDLDMNLSANGESSEWIGSEEWELLDNVHVN
ncbi:hypothetical protein EC991_001972 [Linnemannia zychae]|nr:hypothetical protein EC991_001972 [Linnemannia zychae]